MTQATIVSNIKKLIDNYAGDSNDDRRTKGRKMALQAAVFHHVLEKASTGSVDASHIYYLLINTMVKMVDTAEELRSCLDPLPDRPTRK